MRNIDEAQEMHRGSELYYLHQDEQYNVVKATNAAGTVVEGYAYDDYGTPSFFNGAAQAISASGIGNPYLFTGRRYDQESCLYYYRMRSYDPKCGRFTTRDPIGIWGDVVNLGNGYTYAMNNPWSYLDPLGLNCTGNPLLDNQDVREEIWDAMAESYGHEPFTPTEEQLEDPDRGEKNREAEGSTRREASWTAYYDENGNLVVNDTQVSDYPNRTFLEWPPGDHCTAATCHVHPNNNHNSSGLDEAAFDIIGSDDNLILTDDGIFLYDQDGELKDYFDWEDIDLDNPCNPCKKGEGQ